VTQRISENIVELRALEDSSLQTDKKQSNPLATVAVGCDHAGFSLKGLVVREVEAAGYSILDCGAWDASPSDYPDFARRVGEALLAERAQRGILICGSGVGVSVAASKIPGIRAALCHNVFSARQGVEDDDMNILCLGGRATTVETAAEIIRAFLQARFSGEDRHVRRLVKIKTLEEDARRGAFNTRAGKKGKKG
jgi:ribose 5-phosphate isomerase B